MTIKLKALLGPSVLALMLVGCGAPLAPDSSPPSATEEEATPAPESRSAQAEAQEPVVVTETVTETVTRTVEVQAEPSEAPTPDEIPANDAFESAFGEKAFFNQDDVNDFSIIVEQPTKAACRYRSLGCDAPETGDVVISVPVVIENLSDSQISVSDSLFEIEFADGTRLGTGDGSAFEYHLDADLGYDRTIRPGATLSTSLTFEAPDGEFGIVLMTGSFNAEDLHMWLGSLEDK